MNNLSAQNLFSNKDLLATKCFEPCPFYYSIGKATLVFGIFLMVVGGTMRDSIKGNVKKLEEYEWKQYGWQKLDRVISNAFLSLGAIVALSGLITLVSTATYAVHVLITNIKNK